MGFIKNIQGCNDYQASEALERGGAGWGGIGCDVMGRGVMAGCYGGVGRDGVVWGSNDCQASH